MSDQFDVDIEVQHAVAHAPQISAERGWVDAARQVLIGESFVVFDGMVFDQFSASAMIQVYDGLSAASQAKFAAMSVERAQTMAFAVIEKARG